VRRDLILVFLAMMSWGLGEGMFYFFEPLYLQQMGADALKIGSILGLVGLAMTLSFLPAGYLSDRIGRRPLLITAWVTGTLATVFMALAPSLPLLVVGMVLYGSTGFVTVPLYSYMTAARGRLSVGRVLTLNSAFYNIGYIVGPLLGGYIGERLGLQFNFRFAALIFVFSTSIIFFIRPQPVERMPDGEPAPGLISLWRSSYGRYVLLIFFLMFGMYLPQPLSQNYLQNERGISLLIIGQLLAARSVGIVMLNLVIGQLNARLGYLLTQVGMGLFSVLILMGSGLPAYFAGYWIMGSYITARGLVVAQGRALVQAANMGLAYGMMETAMAAAMVLGPPLAGLLYEMNPDWIYLVSLGMISAGLAVNLLFSPLRQKDIISFEEKEKAAWTQS
jgi:MFS family permease